MPVDTVFSVVEDLETQNYETQIRQITIIESVYSILSDDNPYKEKIAKLLLDAKGELRK